MSNTENLEEALCMPAEEVAPRLLGCDLIHVVDGVKLVGRIVETEAYDQSDAASHSYNGKTPRTEVMFGPAGRMYVYFTYGMHYCCNIVCGPEGYGSGVLFRAVQPIEGEDVMRSNRGNKTGAEATNGPAKLCQALRINNKQNGHNMGEGSLKLILNPPLQKDKIIQTTRIGISKAKDVPWRFYIKDNPYVSKQ